MEKLLNQLVEKLGKAHGDRLVSVVLYGSAAAGDHHAKFSDLNVLCVLSAVTPRELGESESIFRWWREQGNPAPLLLSESEVVNATDCFPIEFTDVKEQHRILTGRDVVSQLVVDRKFYRAQVEHELRAKLLRLRQKASGVLSDSDLLRRLLADSLSTFCVLFRHALILSGIEAPSRKREIIARTHEFFAIDPLPFQKVLDLREGLAKPRDIAPVAVLGSWLEGISLVIEAVDRLENGGDLP